MRDAGLDEKQVLPFQRHRGPCMGLNVLNDHHHLALQHIDPLFFDLVVMVARIVANPGLDDRQVADSFVGVVNLREFSGNISRFSAGASGPGVRR